MFLYICFLIIFHSFGPVIHLYNQHAFPKYLDFRFVHCIFHVFSIGVGLFDTADEVFKFSIHVSGSTLQFFERKTVANVRLQGPSHSK